MDKNNITIRPFSPSDLQELIALFHDAVNAINIRHYSQEQINAWTAIDIERWKTTLAKNIAFVAQIDGIIVGFIDMTHEGYLDRLYIHKDYQARFVALRLLKKIEQTARDLGLKKLTTDCSITAKLPAERMGFVVVKEQTVVCHGVSMTNYVMEKKLS